MGFREEVASESSGSFGEYGERAGPGAQSPGRTGTGAVCGQERGLQGRRGLSVKQLSRQMAVWLSAGRLTSLCLCWVVCKTVMHIAPDGLGIV